MVCRFRLCLFVNVITISTFYLHLVFILLSILYLVLFATAGTAACSNQTCNTGADNR